MSHLFKQLHKLFSEPVFIGIILLMYIPVLSDTIYEIRAEMDYSIGYVYNLLKNLFELLITIAALIYVAVIFRKRFKQLQK